MMKKLLDGAMIGTGIIGALALTVIIAWAADILTVDKDGTVRLRVSSQGNVGIGTDADPASRLTVKGAGTTSATSSMDVQAGDGTSRLFVRDDGNVGVGTANPGYRIDVAGNARINDRIAFSSSSGQFLAYRVTVPASSTIYVPDGDIPRGGLVIFNADGGYSGGIFSIYRHGSYNVAREIAHGPSGMYGFGATGDPGVGNFRFWIENNNAGGRLAVKNTYTWEWSFVLYIGL